MNFQFRKTYIDIRPAWIQSRAGILVSCCAKFIVKTQRENVQLETIISLETSVWEIFSILNDNHYLPEYMYDYYNYPQMFDEPSEYQDETSRAYDRAETLDHVC